MDGWSGALIVEWVIPGLLLIAMIAVLVVRKRLPKTTSLTLCEYWVYLPEPKLPKIEEIMDSMISSNPHNRPGKPCIGAREGMLFSDIRLHMAIARRGKNPHIFRPDLFHPACTPSQETLGRLSRAQAIAKVRYLSEVPLADTRHLQFMPHLADTISRLANGLAVFDPVLDELTTAEEFRQRISDSPNQERIDKHSRVVWLPDELGGVVETRGLRKIGIPELKTKCIPNDERSVVEPVIEEALGRFWREPRELPYSFEFERLGQWFKVQIDLGTLIEAPVTVSRRLAP